MPATSPPTSTLLDQAGMAACLERLATEICAASPDGAPVALVGVHRRGVPMARRIAAALSARLSKAVPLGTIDVTQYRDDLKTLKVLPKLEGSDITFDVNDAHVVLCDEVLHTGRTIRAAMDELLGYGRPRKVQLAVLVDRGGRELPIQPDYTGLHHEVDAGQRVTVRFEEVDGRDTVYLEPWITPAE